MCCIYEEGVVSWSDLLKERLIAKEKNVQTMLTYILEHPKWVIYKQDPGMSMYLPARSVHGVLTVCEGDSWVYFYGTSFLPPADIR